MSSILPATFKVLFTTSQGDFTVEAHKVWAPIAVERFHTLVKERFFDDTRIFRVRPEFVVQFGVSGDPKITQLWKDKLLKDEPVVHSNATGTLAFAMDSLPNSRTTQIFINYEDNRRLDLRKFVPFAIVTEGMSVTGKFYSGYEDRFKDQKEIEEKGNAFLDAEFPKMDRIIKAEIIKSDKE